MKKFYIVIFAMILISGMFRSAEAELIFNGGAEQGDTSGWNNPYPLPIQAVQILQNIKPLDPFAGDYFFCFSEVRIGSGNSVSMTQRGFLTSGVNSLTLSGYFTTEIQDFGGATLSIFDSSDNIISTVLTGPLNIDPEVFVWTYFDSEVYYQHPI